MKISSFHKLAVQYYTAAAKSKMHARPLLTVGPPGSGKTSAFEQLPGLLTETMKTPWQAILFHPVMDDPIDYKGMPATIVREDGTKEAVFLPFGNLKRIMNPDIHTIAIADDLGQAMGGVQAALMPMFLHGQVNGHQISPLVHFGATTNRLEDRAGVTGMLTPLLDRFATVINIEVNLDDWATWNIKSGVCDPSVISWIRHKPDVLLDWKPGQEFKKQGTCRSVSWLGEQVLLGLTDKEWLAGVVGEHNASNYLAFLRVWQDLPPYETIMKNPMETPVPQKLDVMHATMGMIANRVTKDDLEQARQYLSRVSDEFAVYCMKWAATREPKLMNLKAFERFVLDHPAAFGMEAF